MEFLREIRGESMAYRAGIDFSSLAALVSPAGGDRIDFDLGHSGLIEGIDFSGGAFPGLEGTCGPFLTSGCVIALSFLPTDWGLHTARLAIDYHNGVEPATLEIDLEGRGYPMSDCATGQADLVSNAPNQGLPVSEKTLHHPRGLALADLGDGSRLIVADTSNNRVLIWHSIPTSFDQPADVVLGQADFSTAAASTSQNGLSAPTAVHWDGASLHVADSGNHRVMIWDGLPTENNEKADRLLGQSSWTDGNASTIPANANSFWDPGGVCSTQNRLFVSDTLHNRVLIWDTSSPPSGLVDANKVLGQTSMTGLTAGAGSQKLAQPTGLFCTDDYLFVADSTNNRVLIWAWTADQIQYISELGTPEAADVVIGQTNMEDTSADVANTRLKGPTAVFLHDAFVYIADKMNNRILRWDSLPLINGAPAQLVIGQPDMDGFSENHGAGSNSPNALGFEGIDGLFVADHLLITADSANHRVLITPLER
jgi:hypothetical protein